MKKLFFVFLLSLLLGGCTKQNVSSTTDDSSMADETCLIEPTKLLHGQIRYFHNMNLQIPSCPYIGSISFNDDNNEAIGKIIGELDLDPTSQESHDFQYVNIEFYGSTMPDGSIVINRVENAERTRNSIFDL